MGYHVTYEFFQRSLPHIRLIGMKVERGEEARFDVQRRDIGRQQYHFHRMLKAAEIFSEDPALQNLRENCKVSTDPRRSQIIITPRMSKASLHQKTLSDALEELKMYEGNLTTIDFLPSEDFSEEELEVRLESIGWKFFPSTRTSESGKLAYGVERILPDDEPSGAMDEIDDILADFRDV